MCSLQLFNFYVRKLLRFFHQVSLFRFVQAISKHHHLWISSFVLKGTEYDLVLVTELQLI